MTPGPQALAAVWEIPSPLRARGTEAQLWVRPFAPAAKSKYPPKAWRYFKITETH